MKVVFRSKDFNSIMAGGFGFNNRRPMASAWRYQGRVQHMHWRGTFECYWDGAADEGSEHALKKTAKRTSPELVWTVSGDGRLFGLAAALKAQGFEVEVHQDENA